MNTENMTLVGNLAGYNFFIGKDENGKEWYNIHPEAQGVNFPIAGYASKEQIAAIKKVPWPDRFVLPDMYQAWTKDQFVEIEKAIVKHLRYQWRTYEDGRGRHRVQFKGWDHITEIIGLAYTSSSSYAGYWITNVTLRHPQYPDYRYIGFSISHDNKYYAILWDSKENELIIQL